MMYRCYYIDVTTGFRVKGLGFRVQGSGFRVWVWGLGFRVQRVLCSVCVSHNLTDGERATCQV